jgi:hypothetical protein
MEKMPKEFQWTQTMMNSVGFPEWHKSPQKIFRHPQTPSNLKKAEVFSNFPSFGLFA